MVYFYQIWRNQFSVILSLRLKLTIVVALAFLTLTSIRSCLAVTPYQIVPLGINDNDHTRADGYQSHQAVQLNESGQVIGDSERYDGSNYMGLSAWFYDGTTSSNIGLTGNEHTRSDGYKVSQVYQLNEAGLVQGYSNRYVGNTNTGRSEWIYDGMSTINIGLTDEEHTRNDGKRYSQAIPMNEAGQVSGISYRYFDGSPNGLSAWFYNGITTLNISHLNNRNSIPHELNETGHVRGDSSDVSGHAIFSSIAWLYNGTTTIEVGLLGSEHTGSYSRKLNEAGQVTGYSERDNANLGRSAWLYDGNTTLHIGLIGSEHTRDDDYKSSFPEQLNEAGQVSGYASRFEGSNTDLGLSAWFYDGTSTINIGPAGNEHTRDDGYKYSRPDGLNEAGQVRGNSNRYNGGASFMGNTAWLYNGSTTLDIGLVGSEHTRDDGYKSSYSEQMNEAGQVIGVSDRYSGSTFMGNSAWFYDGTTTINIGLVGSTHTRDDGLRVSYAEQMNEAGQVSGSSERYESSSSFLGQSAWLYDPTLDQTIEFELSTRSDGFAESVVNYLGEDGLVLGEYTLFDALDTDLGSRAFYFTIEDGLHDLGTLVEGGLTSNGWELLASAVRQNGMGQILGSGELITQSGGKTAYLLTPVPEPSSLALCLLLCISLITKRNLTKRISPFSL